MQRTMASSVRFDRKLFLTWALSSTSAAAWGCSDAGGDAPPAGGGSGGTSGAGGSGGAAGGAAGTFTHAGTGGTFTSAGTGGTVGGAGGGAGGAGGVSGGAGGAGGSGGAMAMPNCSAQLKVFITSDHGHALDVTLADVMAGAAKAYDTKGKSNHSHWIQLTAADFAKLQAGGTVRKLSCNDGHEHEFIVNCLGVEKPDTTSGVAGFCDAEHKCGDTMGNYCPELG
jgi:hypothetical protein